MKCAKVFLCSVALILVSACTNRAAYDSMITNKRNECYRQPLPVQEECLREANISFEEYQRQRAEILQEEPK